jgi:hypothetical protein
VATVCRHAAVREFLPHSFNLAALRKALWICRCVWTTLVRRPQFHRANNRKKWYKSDEEEERPSPYEPSPMSCISGPPLEARNKVDPVAENITVIDDNVALMNVDVTLDPLFD